MWVQLQECVAEWDDWPEEQGGNWKHQGGCEEGGVWESDLLELCMNSWPHPQDVRVCI